MRPPSSTWGTHRLIPIPGSARTPAGGPTSPTPPVRPGSPKGVEIEHHALTNLVCYFHERLKLTAQDKSSMLAYVAFDASVTDVWPILCAGGTVTIPPEGLLAASEYALINWLAARPLPGLCADWPGGNPVCAAVAGTYRVAVLHHRRGPAARPPSRGLVV